LEENLNYSPERLTKVWPSRFPDLTIATKYGYNPQALANKVYAGRLGNNQESDGWKYHGRGLIQLTGRENYERCGSSLGVDLIGNPDWLLDPKYAALSAGWYWNKHGLNELADAQEHGIITKRINGGTLGLDDRILKTTKALLVLG
jgi:putative chitinase